MQDHQPIKVKAIRRCFLADRSHEPGDEFMLGEQRAVEEGLAGLVSYDVAALSSRARTYRYRLTHPVPGGHPVAY